MQKNSTFDNIIADLRQVPRLWLVTGAAGFIGSHLVEELLLLGQSVIGLDNFSNGTRANLQDIEARVGSRWQNFEFIEGDICDVAVCRQACEGVEVVLHHAAVGSVPRSIATPLNTNQSNVTGFLTLLEAAKNAAVKRFVYASSSSVYGDNTDLPKVEAKTGRPLSPYAVTKVTNELYAHTFASLFDMPIIGLRYFNVFGPRQLPNGPYAAVIPKWIYNLLSGNAALIYGDGTMSRDFCYVKNVVQVNLLAAVSREPKALDRVFNVACGAGTSLNELFGKIKQILNERRPEMAIAEAVYMSPRKGEISHSLADITAAKQVLSYEPRYDVSRGLAETLAWYLSRCEKNSSESLISAPMGEKGSVQDKV